MTLYLKYRPQKLADLDIEDVRQSLEKMVKSQNIPHAMLFAGPRGTGKTSAARIIAKIVNCEKNSKKLQEPCNKCRQCLSITKGSNIDVIELDAASHRGIDDVRALRDAVKLSPVNSRMKVYIVDEAHMLTTEASNALLKTLEEPPAHVLIILATTNPEKLIETIRSRTMEILFRKASNDEIINQLRKITKKEGKEFDTESLRLIADASDGSFRDASKIVEQIINEKIGVSTSKIEEFLNTKLVKDINQLYKCLKTDELTSALKEIDTLIKKGFSAKEIIEKIIEKIRIDLLDLVMNEKKNLANNIDSTELIILSELMFEAQSKVPFSFIEHMPLEIAVIKWCNRKKDSTNIEKSVVESEEEKTNDNSDPIINKGKELNEITENNGQLDVSLYNINDDIWGKILSQIKIINTSIEALLRAAKPVGFDGKTLTIGVYYKFHKERLEDEKNRRILEEVLARTFSAPTRVSCILSEPPVRLVPEKEEIVLEEGGDDEIVKVAKEIFGS